MAVELGEFLLARYADEMFAAQSCSPYPWTSDAQGDFVMASDDVPVAETLAISSGQMRRDAAHIARHDPAHVLADLASKRAVVELWDEADYLNDDGEVCGGNGPEIHRAVLECLALPYADHPDYRSEWRP